MREKIRQRIVESPRAMDGAYVLMLFGVLLVKVGTNTVDTGQGP